MSRPKTGSTFCRTFTASKIVVFCNFVLLGAIPMVSSCFWWFFGIMPTFITDLEEILVHKTQIQSSSLDERILLDLKIPEYPTLNFIFLKFLLNFRFVFCHVADLGEFLFSCSEQPDPFIIFRCLNIKIQKHFICLKNFLEMTLRFYDRTKVVCTFPNV